MASSTQILRLFVIDYSRLASILRLQYHYAPMHLSYLVPLNRPEYESLDRGTSVR
jgi:hypothetical protein